MSEHDIYIVRECGIGSQRQQLFDRTRNVLSAGNLQRRLSAKTILVLHVEGAGLLRRLHQQRSHDLVLVVARFNEGCSPILHKYTYACVSE